MQEAFARAELQSDHANRHSRGASSRISPDALSQLWTPIKLRTTWFNENDPLGKEGYINCISARWE